MFLCVSSCTFFLCIYLFVDLRLGALSVGDSSASCAAGMSRFSSTVQIAQAPVQWWVG